MINIGIIGTNWITHDYITHAQSTGKFNLVAVYSRSSTTASEFASKYPQNKDVAIYTSLEDLANDTNVNTVYIASPNAMHYVHAKQMLNAGKNVIVEKPGSNNPTQLRELFQLAYSKNLILVEAWRHIQEINFKILTESLGKVGKVTGASINFLQYSSRYENVKRGEVPNVFNLEFGAGALADLGCYTVAFAVELFGAPESLTYKPVIVATGADGGGVLLLRYKDFGVSCTFSKISGSTAPSEVFGDLGTLVVPSITDIEKVSFLPKGKVADKVELGKQKEDLNLKEEAQVHGDMIENRDVEAMKRWERHSLMVLEVTEKARRENGLLFPGEK